ncbi:MAG: LysM peptidoglycan-binding domain-containing protein [Acidimicrobiales bacterium]|nr:LysM peptidoglycan-binding domain-containing protein [Acidimicrobiales bacterium]
MPTRSNPIAFSAAPVTRPAAGTRPTGRQVAGGFGALGVLVIGLVGIPIVLSTLVGWPLPHHVPSGTQAAHAFGASIPDSFWPRLFATLAWLAWAYFVFSVATGLILQLRGRRPGHRSHLVGSSAMAALIAAVLILGQLRGAHTVLTGPPPSPAPVEQLLSQTTSGVVPSLPSTPISTAQSTALPATVTHIVVPGDTLWSIAVQYYGDGEQWPAIFQANVGLSQPGGGALTDAHWIYPGWSLTIPGATQAPPVVAATSPAPQTPSPAASSTSPIVTSPVAGTPGSISHGTSGSGAASRSLVPRKAVPVTHQPNANQRPSGTRSVPASHTDTTEPVGATSSRPPLALHQAQGAVPNHAGGSNAVAKVRPPAPHPVGSDIGPIAVGAGLFGLTAIGLVAALDRRRRRQIGRRFFGGRIPRPEPRSPSADLELQLRHYARAGQVFWVGHLAELLGHSAAAAGVAPPDVVGAELDTHGLDVLVTGDSSKPLAPFVRRPDRPDVWHLPFTTDPSIVDEAVTASPATLVLATVGQGTVGAVLVNVNRYRSIHITVSADRVEGILSAMATELAGTTAPIGTAVVAVGFGYGVVDRLDGGVVVDDLDEASASTRPDEKAIVLVDPQTITHQLLDGVRSREDVHLLTAGPVAPEGTVLILDPEHPILENHGLDPVHPSHMSDDSLEEVQTLFELAEEDPGTTAHHGGAANEAHQPSGPVPVGEVMVGLLGEPTISVGDGDLQDLVTAVLPTAGTKARRVVELLVYLAAHGGTATRGEWLTDISPDKALSDGYVRNLVLLTRRSLEAVTGEPDLLAYDKATQRFSLAERVTTDWKQFQSATSVGEPVRLRTALGLVRGAPFGADPDPWTSAGGLSYVFGDAITDASLALGEFALDDGDPRLAAWAARQGQLANRYDQGLWRTLLRTAGDDTARQQIWNELHALLAVDGDPTADLEPETIDLYDLLDAPKRTAAGVVVLQEDDDAVIPTRRAV